MFRFDRVNLTKGITIQVDIEPAHLDRNSSVDLSIVGGATAMAEALDNELDRRGTDEQDRFWTDTLVEQLYESPQVDTREFSPELGRVDPRTLLSELDSLLPDERIVVTDTGQLTTWVINEISITLIINLSGQWTSDRSVSDSPLVWV